MPAKSPEKLNLIHRGHDIDHMQSAINTCNIDTVAQAVRKVLETGAWREYWLGQKVNRFATFPDFLTHHPAKVYGSKGSRPSEQGYWNPAYVQALLKKSGDAQALKMFKQAMQGEHYKQIDAETPDLQEFGANQYSGGCYNKEKGVTPSRGNSEPYALAKLRKHRPDIHAQVLAGKLTAHAGMVLAGYRKPRPTSKRGALEKILALLPKLTAAERRKLATVVCAKE